MQWFMSPIFLLRICLLVLVLVIAFLSLRRFAQYYCNCEICAGKSPVQKLVIAYKCGRGPHKELDAIFKEASTLTPNLRQFIIFYNVARKATSSVPLKWAVGSIVREGAEELDLKVAVRLQEKGYQFYELPHVSSMVQVSVHSLSSWLANRPPSIANVYPQLASYIKVHKLCAHPWLAVHSGWTVHYMAPLARQNEFYVPEFTDDVAVKETESDDMAAGDAPPQLRRRRPLPRHHYKLVLHTPQMPVLRSRPMLSHSSELLSRPLTNARSLYTVKYAPKKTKNTTEIGDDVCDGQGDGSSPTSCVTVPAVQEGPDMNGQLSVISNQSVELDTDDLVKVETDDKFNKVNDTLEEEMYLGADPSDGVIFQYSSDEEQAVPRI